MAQLFSPNSGPRLFHAPEMPASQRLGFRLVVGLIQGLLAYSFYRLTDMDAPQTALLVTLALVTGYAPPLWLAAIGQLSMRGTLIWGTIATVLIAALGLSSGLLPDQESTFLIMAVCLPAALFCAHHLVVPAIKTRSLIAPYESYYETAWKAGIQLVLALMFLGVFWLILLMGALLFSAIGIEFVQELITKPWFVCLATPLFFALGVELSDVRDGLTQGIRTVALTLLSWLLPIAVFIAGAFLIALPLAGLAELHGSLSPAGLMLAASAGLIILINTVYQDGAEHLSPIPFLRLCLRIGVFLLLPMTAFALWAVSVRVGQYGLTLPRIVALTASVIGFLYALGYVLSQFIRTRNSDGWLPLFETTNIFVGALTAVTLVAYSTPWLNPIQLSIDNQFARVSSGKADADEIPYQWLASHSGDKGRAVLEDLSKSKDAVIARRATAALEGRYLPAPDADQKFKLELLPAGTAVPEGLVDALKEDDSTYACQSDTGCLARLYDIDADGQSEVLVLNSHNVLVFGLAENGTWKKVGQFTYRPECNASMVNEDSFRANLPLTGENPVVKPVIIGSTHLNYEPQKDCPVTSD